MLPDAYVCHRTPERMRVKILSKKGDDSYFSALSPSLSELSGVTRVETNFVTGTVLFVSETSLDQEAIAEYAEMNKLFKLGAAPSQRGALPGRVVKSFNLLDEKVRGLTRDEIDAPGMAFLGLLGVGLYQLSIGNFAAPAWYTAFWYATSILLKSHAESRGGGVM